MNYQWSTHFTSFCIFNLVLFPLKTELLMVWMRVSNPSYIGTNVFPVRRKAQALKYPILDYPWMKFYWSFMCGIPTEVSLSAQLQVLIKVVMNKSACFKWGFHLEFSLVSIKENWKVFKGSFKYSIFEHSLPTQNLNYINNTYIQKALP